MIAINCLSDLRKAFESCGKKIKEFGGWYMLVGKDKYTMLDGDIYLNNIKITRKELLAKLKTK